MKGRIDELESELESEKKKFEKKLGSVDVFRPSTQHADEYTASSWDGGIAILATRYSSTNSSF